MVTILFVLKTVAVVVVVCIINNNNTNGSCRLVWLKKTWKSRGVGTRHTADQSQFFVLRANDNVTTKKWWQLAHEKSSYQNPSTHHTHIVHRQKFVCIRNKNKNNDINEIDYTPNAIIKYLYLTWHTFPLTIIF